MARIPAPTRASVPQDQLDAFDEFVELRGGVPGGPLSVMLNAPDLLKRGEHLRAYLRGDGSSLPRPIIELAMLLTARENNCQYIWNAHAAAGRAAGLNDAVVDNLRDRRDLPDLSASEQAVVEYGRELFRTRTASQATFDAALAQFGVRGLAELTSLMGYYALLAFNINAFGVEIPEGHTEAALPI